MTRRNILTVIPLLLVNVTAFSGQLGYLRDHLHWSLAGDIMFALALESIALYLAYHAHLALLSNDSAMKLRLCSYAAGLVVAALNYSHYSGPGGKPTFTAIAVGLMSATSPFLWGIHSRRVSRDLLLARGLVEPHALRLGSSRWMWHPVRSMQVMYAATWTGERDPARAIRSVKDWTVHRLPDQASKADAVRLAVRTLTEQCHGVRPDVQQVASWLHDHAPQLDVSPGYIRDVMRRDSEALAAHDHLSGAQDHATGAHDHLSGAQDHALARMPVTSANGNGKGSW